MEALTATKKGFTITVAARPQPGQQTLRGTCLFSEFNDTSFATVQLGLISRKHQAIPFSEPWLAELEFASTRVTVKPGPDGSADFELPYPVELAPFLGKALEIAVTLVAQTGEGTTIRLILADAPQPQGVRRRLQGLPAERRLKAPVLPWVTTFLVAVTLALIFIAWRNPTTDLYKGAFGSSVLSLVLVLVSFKPALRWFRLGAVRVRVEEIANQAEPRLRVIVQGGRSNGMGKVSLIAAEYIYSESSLYKYDPMVCVESRLQEMSDGHSAAELSLPPADQAPPSICLKRAGTRHGILWELRLELENRSGGVGQLEIPITVGLLRG